MSDIPQHTLDDIDRVNASGRTPVVFIHGLWLLPSSWDRWAEVFDAAGYAAISPGWPDDPSTVSGSSGQPGVSAVYPAASKASAQRSQLLGSSHRP